MSTFAKLATRLSDLGNDINANIQNISKALTSKVCRHPTMFLKFRY